MFLEDWIQLLLLSIFIFDLLFFNAYAFFFKLCVFLALLIP